MNMTGLLATGFKTYRRQNKMSLISTLVPEEAYKNGRYGPSASSYTGTKTPSLLEKVSDLGEDMIAAVSSSYAEAQTVVQKIKREKIAPLFGNVRNQQIREIGSAPADAETSAAERESRRTLVIASANLALAAAGAAFFPPLYLASTACLIYLNLSVFRSVYKSLVVERRLRRDVVSMLIVTGAMVGGLFVAAAIATWFNRLNRFLVIKTEDNSKKSLVNLFGEQPRFAWMLVDGTEIEVPFEHIRVGDIVVVNAGQAIPIDGTITEGIASIDQQRLTGEAQPAEKSVGDPVFSTTIVLAGKIHVRVEKAGQETVVAQIGDILDQTIDYRQVVQQRWEGYIEKLVPSLLVLSGVALPFAGLNGAVAVLWYYPGYRMIVFSPLSMLSFLHVAARQGILIKDGRSLEMLGDVDTVVFDKTGTLTLEQPHVGHVYSCNGFSEAEILVYAAAAEHRQSHPIALAILAAADERKLDLLPIDDARYEIGYGIKVRLNDQTVLVGSDRFMALEGIAIPSAIQERQMDCHAQGHSLVMVAFGDVLAGAIELRPTVRPEAKRIIDQLRQRNLEVVIISGDHDAPTSHLARELGIDRYFAEVLPADKAQLVKDLQQTGRKVCFVGDGINDAIALKEAHVSVSLQGATTVAIDTAQIVLMGESIQHLGHLFEVVDDFEASMKFNVVASIVPSLLGISATFLFGWGFLAAAIVSQVTTPIALYNTLRPLLDQPRESGDGDSDAPHS